MFEFIIAMIILSLYQVLFRKSFTGRGSRMGSNRLQLSVIVITEILNCLLKVLFCFLLFIHILLKTYGSP